MSLLLITKIIARIIWGVKNHCSEIFQGRTCYLRSNKIFEWPRFFIPSLWPECFYAMTEEWKQTIFPITGQPNEKLLWHIFEIYFYMYIFCRSPQVSWIQHQWSAAHVQKRKKFRHIESHVKNRTDTCRTLYKTCAHNVRMESKTKLIFMKRSNLKLLAYLELIESKTPHRSSFKLI